MRANRARIAFSFADQASRHIGRMDGFSNLVHLLTNENASLMGLPNITSAGDTLQSGSGVFLSCSMARNSPSLSSEPVGPMLSIRVRLAFLTATSARPLDCGKATEDMRWWTPHRDRKLEVSEAVNSGPPSLDRISGTPKVANIWRRQAMRPVAPE